MKWTRVEVEEKLGRIVKQDILSQEPQVYMLIAQNSI